MQVMRMGDGLGVQLPASMVDTLKLREGDDVEIRVTSTKDADGARDRAKIREMLIQFRQYRGSLPKDFRFDREGANARR